MAQAEQRADSRPPEGNAMTAAIKTQPPKRPEAATAEPSTLIEAVLAGTVRLVRQRKNGTLRSLPYLQPGSDQRKEAETVAALRAKGETINAISEELNRSVATVRRMVTNLEFANAIEAGEYADKWSAGDTTVVISVVGGNFPDASTRRAGLPNG